MRLRQFGQHAPPAEAGSVPQDRRLVGADRVPVSDEAIPGGLTQLLADIVDETYAGEA
jgi:hypothetical protein